MNPRNNKTDPDVAGNPLPSPRTGDANMVGPADRAQEATSKPYDAEVGHIEPAAEHDDEGVRRDEHGKGVGHAPDQKHPDQKPPREDQRRPSQR